MRNFSLIVAIANNNAIGKNGNLLLHLSEDLKWFKKNTIGHTVIMGRKTFETLPSGALPKRKNIILSRNKDYKADDCIIVNEIAEIENFIEKDETCFIIGGAEIYKQFLPRIDKMYITRIYADFDADTFFPEIDFTQWKIIEKIQNKANNKNKVDFDFIVYEKK